MTTANITIEPLNIRDIAGIDKWHKRFDLFCTLNKDITDDTKIIYYLSLIGKDAFDLVTDLAYPKQVEDLKVATVQEILRNHLEPVNFEATERAKFHNLTRRSDEKLRDFLLRLQQQSAKCNFGNQLEIALRDRIIAGINNPAVQRKLLSVKGLTYTEAKTIVEECDNISQVMNGYKPEPQVLFHSKKRPNQNRQNQFNRPKFGNPGNPNSNRHFQAPSSHNHDKSFSQANKSHVQNSNLGSCFSCGGKHHRSICKFRDAICNQCKKPGHIQRVCRQSIVRSHHTEYEEVDELTDYIQALGVLSQNDHLHESLLFETGRSSEFILDTGSPLNFMPIEKFDELGFNRSDIQPSKTVIRGVSGHTLPVIGEFICSLIKDDKTYNTKFAVTPKGPSILGLDGLRSLKFNIVLMTENKRKHNSDSLSKPEMRSTNSIPTSCSPNPQPSNPHTSNELSSQTRAEIHKCSGAIGGMRIDPVRLEVSSPPKFFKARPLAFGIRDGVKAEIDKLVEDGILSPVKSSSWATPIVVVRKPNGSFRICGDYSVTANQSLKLTSFTTPGMEDMFTEMQGCSHYTKIDLTNAFLQIPLAEDSKEVTTINTIWGLYSYNFLPFGLNISPGIFQQSIDEIIRGLDGVKSYQDDLLVFGKTQQQHNIRLSKLLTRLNQFNVKINAKKSMFNVPKVHYLGYVIDANGISPDSDRVAAVANAPNPTNVKELRSLLGFMQYYSKFVPHFSTKAEPLFQLSTQLPQSFQWSTAHSNCLKGLIHDITNGISLQSFQPGLNSRVIVDASEVGLGAVLEQQDLPILCISRRLSQTEKGYSQTQKEALAIKWALQRLHKFLFGSKFVIVTDHKALEYIFSPSNSASKTKSNMLQRWALEISAYNYTIEHAPGKRIPHADFLSRYSNFLPDDTSTECYTINPLPFDRNFLISETKAFYGPVLAGLRNGWSVSGKKRFPQLYNRREELSMSVDGVIQLNDLILIPPACRQSILAHLHDGHMGRDKMKSLARLLCWWPTINADIVAHLDKCQRCKIAKPIHHSKWLPWPHTSAPMVRIHADYCGPFLNQYYALVIEDSYSKYPEIFLTKSANAAFTKTALRKFFAREGIPQVLVTDNGTHFNQEDLKLWLKSIGVTQLFTAPRHPCSNGLAERFVQTIKTVIRSCEPQTYQQLDSVIDNFLMQYRNAEHSTTRRSPAYLFKGRNLRTSSSLDTTEIMFFRGNESRAAIGVVVRQLGNRMVEIIDQDDGSIHRRHIDQIKISRPPSESSSLSSSRTIPASSHNESESIPSSVNIPDDTLIRDSVTLRPTVHTIPPVHTPTSAIDNSNPAHCSIPSVNIPIPTNDSSTASVDLHIPVNDSSAANVHIPDNHTSSSVNSAQDSSSHSRYGRRVRAPDRFKDYVLPSRKGKKLL